MSHFGFSLLSCPWIGGMRWDRLPDTSAHDSSGNQTHCPLIVQRLKILFLYHTGVNMLSASTSQPFKVRAMNRWD